MTQEKPKTPPMRDCVVTFKVTTDEKSELVQLAEERSLNLSAWIRRVVFAALEKERR